MAVAVARHHLPHMDALRITSEGGGNRPALKHRRRLGCGDGMEVIVAGQTVARASDARHSFILLNGIGDLREIHTPALRHEDTETHAHHSLRCRASRLQPREDTTPPKGAADRETVSIEHRMAGLQS